LRGGRCRGLFFGGGSFVVADAEAEVDAVVFCGCRGCCCDGGLLLWLLWRFLLFLLFPRGLLLAVLSFVAEAEAEDEDSEVGFVSDVVGGGGSG